MKFRNAVWSQFMLKHFRPEEVKYLTSLFCSPAKILHCADEVLCCTERNLELLAVCGDDGDDELSATNTDSHIICISHSITKLTSSNDRLSADSSGQGCDQNVHEVNINDEVSATNSDSYGSESTSYRCANQLSSSVPIRLDSSGYQSSSTIGNRLFPIRRMKFRLHTRTGRLPGTYSTSRSTNNLLPDPVLVDSSKDQSSHYKHVSTCRLKQHMRNSKRQHSCSDCQRKFADYYSLVHHMRTSHNVDRPLACSICRRLFMHRNNLRRHMILHRQESPAMVADEHLYPEDRKTLFSRICPDTNLKIQVSGTGKSSPMGNIMAPAESSMSMGRRSPFRTKEDHCCTVCSKTFASSSELLIHVQAHSAKCPVACHICGKHFAYSGGLKSHMRTHTGEKPFCCSVCQLSFSGRTSLKTHMRRHTGEKPYSCSSCGRGFTTMCGLKRHTESHSRERRFSCEFCDKMFSGAQVLKIHMRTHSGDRPFSCFVCQSTFTQLGNLKTHIRQHTGEKPHCCADCDKQFVTAAKLRRHQQTHNDKRKFTCDVCQCNFSQLCKLRQHASVHDKDKK